MSMMLTVTCTCGKTFQCDIPTMTALNFGTLPRRCPECLDIAQGRPEIVESRKTLFERTVLVDESIAQLDWKKFQAQEGDRKTMRAIIKGSQYGASWSGRIDIYSHVGRPQTRQAYLFAQKEVKKKIWVKRWEKDTMEHGKVSGYHRCASDDDGAEERKTVDKYCVLLPPPIDKVEQAKLIFVTAHTKTTINGLGRQYWATFEGEPLWQMGVLGGYRSGRASTDARLAVVNKDHPLCVVKTGDLQETVVYR